MLENIISLRQRYAEINEELAKSHDDYQIIADLAKERSDLEPIINAGKLYMDKLEQIEEANTILETETDEEFRALAQSDIFTVKPEVKSLENQIKTLRLPTYPRDKRNVIIEIRAGAGGDEAGLFSADLFRMYSRYADNRNWKLEVVSQNETGIGGFKEIIFMIKGKSAYSRLKFESGVHRVQRIPSTETSGRIHTSTVTVAVLAEVDDIDIQIPETDINIDVYKSAGAGGQNVQKNSTAVRLTHLPSGIVVSCQDERSQLQNKLRAMSILKARLYEIEEQNRRDTKDASRRSQIGSGERSEKIRTYNYPQSRVTDHRINVSSHNLPVVMEGDIDMFIDELIMKDETDRMSSSISE